ncbi:sugar phosphate isomerase/epimerase family protein [Roseibacillus ishigakijimensis]|uniref:Sugar phosphate isomerase/epimerase n=1 Tax=Roseibacillus ishigakijimensis TaxID=454146 RepID=A0A934RKN1_9BACT|nr:sugar phosphate isomerase/epimerase family protein [Roseibacillus ishigakijimensis]MBK1832598.1 sugar phosphate isomerase/epimerase [Roseibacillus ishigakijimensis]
MYPNVALHTFTTKPWSISECIENYARRGIGGISIWRETVENANLKQVRQQYEDAGLTPVSYVRGGFFPALDQAEREAQIATNRQWLRDAAELGMPSVVLVCGAAEGQSPLTNRAQIRDGIAALAEEAAQLGLELLIEPLHPVYCGNRSAIPTLKAANDLCAELALPHLKVAVDVYHVWWDHELEPELKRCADHGWLGSYHICDYKSEPADMLLDRGIMGEGACNLAEIDRWVTQDNGFSGLREIEIFSSKWWQRDQNEFLDEILKAYDAIYSNPA